MKSDKQIKQDVERELEWDAAGIGVEVRDRIVTLAGHLSNYSEKLAAEKAAQRVEGVGAVVVELDVRIRDNDKRTDEDIATSARSLLHCSMVAPCAPSSEHRSTRCARAPPITNKPCW